MAAPSRLDSVISLAKRRGFVFPSGEIYGGTRSAWDYGPLGVELKENIKRQWWNRVVRSREDVVGLDSSVILPKRVWETSGHVQAFTDPLVECLSCHKRLREDQLIEAYAEKHDVAESEVTLAIVACPNCGTRGQFTEPRAFSGLLKTFLGPVDDEAGLHFLRPETAQGIFTQFANVMASARKKPPFGIGQIGKSFRNDITPGNFILDIEYTFGFQGSQWGELEGIANRTDYDLSVHAEASGQKLDYFDQTTNERWTPYVIEPSAGLTRSLMAFLIEAYHEDEAPNAKGGVDKRVVLKLDHRLAPVKVAVLPLSRKEELTGPARELAQELRALWNIEYDDAGAVGRRYRRQDEIGTPFCVTYDFDSLEDGCVTIRENRPRPGRVGCCTACAHPDPALCRSGQVGTHCPFEGCVDHSCFW